MVWIVLLVACLTGAVSPTRGAEAAPPEREREFRPILFVGIDGMEWDVILPLLREGRLPTISGLMQRGSFGELVTTEPTISPIIWTTIATGVTGADHGVLGFSHKTGPDTDDELLYTSVDRTAKAFWNILSEHDRRVEVIGWWLTYPAEVVNGVMVAQANTSSVTEILAGDKLWRGALEQGLPRQVYPPERQEEFLKAVPRAAEELPEITRRIFGDIENGMGPVPRKLWENCLWAFRADETYRRIALKLLAEKPTADILSVYLGGTDIVGHRFWRYYQPDFYKDRPTKEEIANYRDVIPAYYVEVDRILGQLLAAGPPDTNVLIVSDHGMRANHPKRDYVERERVQELRSGGHRNAPSGVFIAAGPDINKRERPTSLTELKRAQLGKVGSIFDVTPTILALLGVPVGRDMNGSVLTDVISAAALEAHPPRWIDTHTTADWLESRANQVVPTLDEEERLEQLRSLGYID
jgi:predicted AlkP superfamily phosphohydrolase/phosphomutase